MAEPIILALHLRFFGSSHAYTLLSHKPVSHPTRGKMSDMIRIDGYSLRSIAFHELTYSIKNTVAQTAPTMVPMARPLRGAWRYCCSSVFLWVVIGAPLWWCGGRRRLRCRRGRCRFGLGWLCGAVILSIGHAVTVSGDLDRESQSVTGAGGIGDAQVCLVCSDSGEGAGDFRCSTINFVVSVTV